jgi:hypothetical protein
MHVLGCNSVVIQAETLMQFGCGNKLREVRHQKVKADEHAR